MSDPSWIEVWCQGGDADGYRYSTLIEPPNEILIFADPFHPGRWIRVVGPWAGAIPYERVRSVEQLDNERIYYPVQQDEARDHSGESPGAEQCDGPRSASCTERAIARHGTRKGDKVVYECPSAQHGTSESPGVCGVVVPWGRCEQHLVRVVELNHSGSPADEHGTR